MALHPDASKQKRWLELIGRWQQQSQLTIREFCERHQVSEASFFSWRRVLRQRGLLDEPAAPKAAKSTPQSPAFVKLTPVGPEPTAASAVELVLGDRRVLRVRPGFDAELLLELVRLLEEPSC
jgi:transposase-like protein